MNEENELDILGQEIIDEETIKLLSQLSSEEKLDLLDIFLKYIVP